MKNIKAIFSDIKLALYDDKVNLYMLIAQIIAFVTTYTIWQQVITRRGIFIYSVTNYFPLQIFSFIIIVHLILAVYSYKNDKNISYLLMGGSSFLMLIIITIEFFYILNR